MHAHDDWIHNLRRRDAFLVLVLLAATAYTLVVTVLHLAADLTGGDVWAYEHHLAVIAVLGLVVMLEGGMILLPVVAVVVLWAAWRAWRRGWKGGTDTVFAALLVLLVLGGVYANVQGMKMQRLHERMLAAAIAKGDRKQLREVVFGCDAFCGFDRDSAALVWLVAHADSDADLNAIGNILRRDSSRNVPSSWLPDKRTALQVAVDRYADNPALALYVLGIDASRQHFPLPQAQPQELQAAMDYALRRQAAPALVLLLKQRGARAPEGSLP